MSSGTYTMFQFDHKTFCAIAYTPCYNQYGKFAQMLDWNTEQKLFKTI